MQQQPDHPILTTLEGKHVQLPYLLGEGSRGVVRAGEVDGHIRAYKMVIRTDKTKAVWRTLCAELDIERERMATVQARREREGKAMQPFLRLYDAATNPQHPAAYRERSGAPPQECLYIAMQPLKDPTIRRDSWEYVSLDAVIWSWELHMAGIAAKKRGDPDSILQDCIALVRALHWATSTVRAALEEDGLVCPDHCLNNVFINKDALDFQEEPDTYIIDLGNTAIVKPPGACMHSADGTIPTPPCPHAALIPTTRAAQREEKQLPTYTRFHAAPEQLMLMMEGLRLRAALRAEDHVVGKGAKQGLWLTDRTLAFNYGCTLHNTLRSQLYTTKLAKDAGDWPDFPQQPTEPPHGATEEARTAYQQQLADFETAKKAVLQHKEVQQARVAFWWPQCRRKLMNEHGHPIDAKAGLWELRRERGLEWLEGALQRLERLSEAATRPLPTQRCSLADVDNELRSLAGDLVNIAMAKVAGSSPGPAASVPSTAASPQMHCPAPPASPDTSPAPLAAAIPSQAGAVNSRHADQDAGQVAVFEQTDEREEGTADAREPSVPAAPDVHHTPIPQQTDAVISNHPDRRRGQVFNAPREREAPAASTRGHRPPHPAAPATSNPPATQQQQSSADNPHPAKIHHHQHPAAGDRPAAPLQPRTKAVLLGDIKAAQKARGAPHLLPRVNGVPAHNLPFVPYHAKVVQYSGHMEGGWKWNPLVEDWEMWQPSGEGPNMWEVRAATQDLRMGGGLSGLTSARQLRPQGSG
ncbi:unnamed protein product [Vitrella brassicaformis CCMP3155]|uniref:Protein kinase domain-containing protein n=1 Tax=Vitrella brassicaformis (strain CCMP3155) TaxID=1169540 RepID=A0A0G4H3R6_VITBC|nr:unnamed protein product [Vitrella brassicaformis CCMP3155]|eukprot:CEM38147.1 unnamed protein product [Vitrella brassicaformis CCMP3155]